MVQVGRPKGPETRRCGSRPRWCRHASGRDDLAAPGAVGGPERERPDLRLPRGRLGDRQARVPHPLRGVRDDDDLPGAEAERERSGPRRARGRRGDVVDRPFRHSVRGVEERQGRRVAGAVPAEGVDDRRDDRRARRSLRDGLRPEETPTRHEEKALTGLVEGKEGGGPSRGKPQGRRPDPRTPLPVGLVDPTFSDGEDRPGGKADERSDRLLVRRREGRPREAEVPADEVGLPGGRLRPGRVDDVGKHRIGGEVELVAPEGGLDPIPRRAVVAGPEAVLSPLVGAVPDQDGPEPGRLEEGPAGRDQARAAAGHPRRGPAASPVDAPIDPSSAGQAQEEDVGIARVSLDPRRLRRTELDPPGEELEVGAEAGAVDPVEALFRRRVDGLPVERVKGEVEDLRARNGDGRRAERPPAVRGDVQGAAGPAADLGPDPARAPGLDGDGPGLERGFCERHGDPGQDVPACGRDAGREEEGQDETKRTGCALHGRKCIATVWAFAGTPTADPLVALRPKRPRERGSATGEALACGFPLRFCEAVDCRM